MKIVATGLVHALIAFGAATGFTGCDGAAKPLEMDHSPSKYTGVVGSKSGVDASLSVTLNNVRLTETWQPVSDVSIAMTSTTRVFEENRQGLVLANLAAIATADTLLVWVSAATEPSRISASQVVVVHK